MALDESLLLTSPKGLPGSKVRVYRWDRRTLTVGAHTIVDPGTVDRCEQEGICLVRRPTGGGAVLHSDDVTYSVIAPALPGGVLGSYRWVAQALIAGLKTLGVNAQVVQHDGPANALACFTQPTGADLQAEGKKICGSAQLRRNGWFLQHGSLPLTDSESQIHRLLGMSSGGGFSPSPSVFEGVTWDEVAKALVQGFRDVWGHEAEKRSPTPEETLSAESLVETRYSPLLTL